MYLGRLIFVTLQFIVHILLEALAYSPPHIVCVICWFQNSKLVFMYCGMLMHKTQDLWCMFMSVSWTSTYEYSLYIYLEMNTHNTALMAYGLCNNHDYNPALTVNYWVIPKTLSKNSWCIYCGRLI